MKTLRFLTPIILLFLGFSACAPINGLFATPTPTYEPCAYMWATYTDETGTALLQSLLTEQSLPFVAERTRVSDFGEDCVTASGVNKGFGAMETDFSVMREITAKTTDAEIGEYAIAVINVVAANFEKGKNINGANRGYVEFILLTPDGQEQYHRVQVDEAIRVIDPGVTPEDFHKQYFAAP